MPFIELRSERTLVEPLENRRLLSYAPAGSEFVVASFGGAFFPTPSVAVDGAGNAIIVWGQHGAGSDQGDIYGRRYDPQGGALGPSFRINTTIAGTQHSPEVAIDAAGNFIVVWSSASGGAARCYDAQGNPLGNEFTISPASSTSPTVATTATGEVAIAWRGSGSNGTGVYYRRYDLTGAPAGAAVFVRPYEGTVAPGGVAIDDESNVTVSWRESGDVYARSFSPADVPLGEPFRLNRRAPADQYQPQIGADSDGDLLAVWDTNEDVWMRRLPADGTGPTRDVRVNTKTAFQQTDARLSIADNDRFIVVYDSDSRIGVQPFLPDGSADGDEIFPGTSGSPQYMPDVATRGNGEFIVVWYSSILPGSGGQGIVARRYAPVPNPEPKPELDLVSSSDSGVSDADEITNDNTPTFGGAAAAGSLVRLFDDGVEIASTVAEVDNTYAITAPTRFDGHRRFRVTIAPPGGGGVLSSQFLYVVIDTTPLNIVQREFQYQRAPQAVNFQFNDEFGGTLTAGHLNLEDVVTGGPLEFTVAEGAFGDAAHITFPQYEYGAVPDGRYRVDVSSAGVTDLAGNLLLEDFSLDFFFLQGDATRNGKVDLFDFNLLAYSFGQNATFDGGDFNYDGRVNLNDFNILAQRFGNMLPTSPTAMSLTDELDSSADDAMGDSFPR